jgi:parvulin-like peptidyl-prolyl isomerase
VKRLRAFTCAVVSMVAVATAGCDRPAPPREAHVALGGDVVARVGDVPIPGSLVASVAAANAESPQKAVSRLVDDALAAQGARAQKLDTTPAGRRDLDALHARLVVTRFRELALAQGPPTDAEVEALTKVHFREVALPEHVQVIHAIALRPKKDDPTAVAHARAVAARIEAAVTAATSTDDFEARADAVPHDEVDVKVERLPPFTATGELVQSSGKMDSTFAAAAYALPTAGSTSKVIETSFGWHVIRLIERYPAVHMPLEERRALFTDEVIADRARRAYEPLVASLRQRASVAVADDADELMAPLSRSTVRVSSPPGDHP